MAPVWGKWNSRFLARGAAALASATLFSVPDQLAAQQSASASAMLEEIIVTARRREENLLELPVSVVAIGADAMRAQGIYNIDDIGDYVPNLAFETTDRRHVKAVFIRGIGNGSAVPLVSVGTGVYLDGHYLPNTVGQMMSTVDIERVEVLRGPQGTLFGKNTTGGAINIISAKPQDEFAADLLLRVAEFGQQDVRGMINVPFSDTVAGRFSAAKEVSDGHYFNRTLNSNIGATDLEAFGAAVRITPNENWLVDLAVRANYQDDDDVGGQCRARPTESQVANLANMNPGVLQTVIDDPAEYAQIVANHPPQIYTGPVFDDGASQWGGATRYPDGTRANIGGHLERLYPGATIDYWNACTADNQQGDFVNSQEKDTFLDLDNENINATIQWNSAGKLGAFDDLTVKLIAARHEMSYNYTQDRDLSFLPIDAIGTLRGSPGTQRNTTTVELLFTADVSDRTRLTFGTHYFDDEALSGDGDCLNVMLQNLASIQDPNGGSFPCADDGGTRSNFMPGRQVPGGPPEAGARSGIIVNESLAFYGHLTFDINDNWTLDLGARDTDEDRRFNQVEFPGECSSVPPFLPPTELCRVNLELNYGSVFDGGLYNDASANFSETTPLISLTRNLGGRGGALDDGIVYFRYAEGFLSGSFNDELQVTLFPELAPLVPYGPEHVDNYEVGFKGTFADGRVRLSSAVFYMDYEDKQEGACFDNANERFGTRAFLCFTTNVASVDIYGIELELRASPWDGGFVSLDVGYLQNEYGEFTAFDPDTGADIDFSNLTIRDYSPEWTVGASIEHTFMMANGATLTPRLAAYYQSEYDYLTGVAEGSPPSFCLQDSYARVQARLTYAPPSENWQASLFGYNIGDERYFDYCDSGRSGVFNYRYAVPAQWGVEFNYRWGT